MRAPEGSYRLSLAVGGSEGEGTGLPVLGCRIWTGIRVIDMERGDVRRLDAIEPGWRSRVAWAPTTTGVHIYVEEWERGQGVAPPGVAKAGYDKGYQSRAYSRGWWHERVRPARIRVPADADPDWRERLEQHAEAMARACRIIGHPGTGEGEGDGVA